VTLIDIEKHIFFIFKVKFVHNMFLLWVCKSKVKLIIQTTKKKKKSKIITRLIYFGGHALLNSGTFYWYHQLQKRLNSTGTAQWINNETGFKWTFPHKNKKQQKKFNSKLWNFNTFYAWIFFWISYLLDYFYVLFFNKNVFFIPIKVVI
jgi:hypothetical protein